MPTDCFRPLQTMHSTKRCAAFRGRTRIRRFSAWSAAAAHNRFLNADELSVVLRPTSHAICGSARTPKSEAGANAMDDTSKMKKGWRHAEGWPNIIPSRHDCKRPEIADRKRNRDKDYSHTAKRSDLESRIRDISPRNGVSGTRRRRTICGSLFRAAFFQRPLQDSDNWSANARSSRIRCEPRGARLVRSCSASMSRLANLRIAVGRAPEQV